MNLLTALGLVLALVIGLLAVPLELQFRLSAGKGLEQKLGLVWAFGLARMSLLPGRRQKQNASQDAPRKKQRRSRHRGPRTSRALQVLGDKPLRRRLLRYLADLWRVTRKRDLRLQARIGFDDPADTGQLWAFAGPAAAALANIRDASIYVEPDFGESVFELDTSGRISAVPLRLIGLSVMLLLSPRVLRYLLPTRRKTRV